MKKRKLTIQEQRKLSRARKIAPPELCEYQEVPEQIVLPDNTWLEIYHGHYVPEKDGIR